MLADLIEFLACPVCGEGLVASRGSIACRNNHSFDIARQGYVNLLTGSRRPGTADTAEMVRARAAFLSTGHFEALAKSVARLAAEVAGDVPGCVVDVGAGTGYYLVAALKAMPERAGVALDISKEAARVAARAHPRVAAVVADTWRALPVRTGSAAVVLDVFAPRNLAEFSRVLAEGGGLVVAMPTRRHLGPLVTEIGLVSVDERKTERLDEAAGGLFERITTETVEREMPLSHEEIALLVGMGPSARHGNGTWNDAIRALPDPYPVRLSVEIVSYRKEPVRKATG